MYRGVWEGGLFRLYYMHQCNNPQLALGPLVQMAWQLHSCTIYLTWMLLPSDCCELHSAMHSPAANIALNALILCSVMQSVQCNIVTAGR